MIGAAAACAAIVIPIAWEFLLHDYQRQRVLTLLDPEADALGTGWNIIQSKTAIGSGGFSGKVSSKVLNHICTSYQKAILTLLSRLTQKNSV